MKLPFLPVHIVTPGTLKKIRLQMKTAAEYRVQGRINELAEDNLRMLRALSVLGNRNDDDKHNDKRGGKVPCSTRRGSKAAHGRRART